MEPDEYEKMFFLEKRHWWFFSKRRFIHIILESFFQKKNNLKILDVGCGTGIVLLELNKYGKTVGIDVSINSLKFCRRRKIENILLSEAQELPFKKESFDLVMALDVIEHLDYDIQVMKEFKRICKKDGYLLVTVPAFEFLWSPHDDALCHKRRYVKTELVKKIRLAGFTIVKSTYLYFTFFPFIAFTKKVNKASKKRVESEVGEFSRPVNDFLISFLTIETSLIRYIDLPFGSSILCLARNSE